MGEVDGPEMDDVDITRQHWPYPEAPSWNAPLGILRLVNNN